jgi:KipI family sensor histidine kinase inhibitor
VGDAAAVLALADAVRGSAAGALAVDVVPAAATVLVTTLPRDHAAAGRALTAVEARFAARTDAPVTVPSRRPADTEVLTLPVVFDGPDLHDVAAAVGLDVSDVVDRLVTTTWTTAFTGFAPGFGYLVGGELAVPRLASPRARVPAGSVGLAGPYAGVYPRASPGGWRLVGTVAEPAPRLFDADRDPPALVRPGVRVRFAAAGVGAMTDDVARDPG